MARWVVYRTADGEMLRHGYVSAADDLGTVQADETAVQDTTVFEPDRLYQWSGSAFDEVGPKTKVVFFASSTRAGTSDLAIAAGPSWTLLERVFTTTGFFTRDATAYANAIGLIETTGGTVELRIVEDPGHDIGGGVFEYDGTEDRVLTDNGGAGFYTLPDSSGVYRAHDIKSDVALTLDDHQCEYRLEARLGTATSANARAPSMALMEQHGPSS
jgi:hypothetical protein